MPLNIKNDQVSQLANQLARETGESITEAVGKSIEARLSHLHRRAERQGLADKLSEIGRKVQQYASETPEGREWLTRDFDAELFDEQGLPR